MDLSRSIKCLLRNREVVATPEEKVRQQLIRDMVGPLGFPRGLLSIEQKIDERRLDLVCYTPECKPLLLIECKAFSCGETAFLQALGYNEELGALFLCLAGPEKRQTFWYEKRGRQMVPFLPFYEELYAVSRRL